MNRPTTTKDCTSSPEDGNPLDTRFLNVALKIISTQRAAVTHLESYYQTNDLARAALSASIDIIHLTFQNPDSQGKLIISGIGKSGKLGEKLAATFTSLGLQSCFLHPTDALHGDLGIIQPKDAVLMLTSSGRTPELINLLPHIPRQIPIIVLASCAKSSDCKISRLRPNSILLPAPVHESEEVSIGIPVPTTTTVNAHAVGNSLAVAVSARLYAERGKCVVGVFRSNHPGGAIGERLRSGLMAGSVRSRL